MFTLAKWNVRMPERAESVTTPEGPPRPTSAHGRAKGRGRWGWILAIAVVLGGALFVWQRHALAKAKAQAPRSPPPLAVTTATASQGDIGVHLDALGTVTPLATVTVRSRVDGQLMAVNYREGQMVHQGEVLAEIDPRPFQVQLTQAQGQYQRDLALLENARIDLDRYRSLYARDAVPKQILDTQVALVHQDEGVLKNDRGLIDNAKLQLVYSRITSPISGRVGLRLVDPGNIVHATDTGGLLMITQLQPITVVFSIAEDFLPEIQQQLRLGHRLSVDALDRAQQKRIATGEVLTFDNQIDTTTGTVRLKAVFPNQDDALFPSQFVNARLLVDVHRGATLVPSAAVQRSAQSAFLYLVKSDQTVSVQAVSLGAADGDVVEIVKGLKPGDVIAIDNFDKLQDGIRISPRTAVAEGTGRSTR